MICKATRNHHIEGNIIMDKSSGKSKQNIWSLFGPKWNEFLWKCPKSGKSLVSMQKSQIEQK